MTEVEDDEAANMKAFLKQLNLEPKHQSNMGLDSVQDVGEALNRGAIDLQVSGEQLEDEKQQSYINEEDGGAGGLNTRPS